MKSSVTVSLVPEVRGGPFVFWDDLEHACQRASELGFEAIEIFPPSAEALNEVGLTWLLQKYDLHLAALGSGAGWAKHKWSLTSPDPAIREQAKQFIKGLINIAGDLKSQVIVGSMQGRFDGNVTREQALEWLAGGLRELAKYAAARRAVVLYEFLNRYETNLLTRVEDVIPFIRRLDMPNVKVLADLFHMNIEEASVPNAIRELGPLLGHVHFVDSNRRPVGFGHTDFPPIMQALRDIAFTGYLSAEALPYPSSDVAAEQTIKALNDLAP